jgi:hypothetical protein
MMRDPAQNTVDDLINGVRKIVLALAKDAIGSRMDHDAALTAASILLFLIALTFASISPCENRQEAVWLR